MPPGAIKFIEEETSEKSITDDKLLKPEFKDTKPRVRYSNLHLLKPFITGAIYNPEADECIQHAKVTLTEEPTGEKRETYTDEFGDFLFKGLEPNKTFTIKIEKEGCLQSKLRNYKLKGM